MFAVNRSQTDPMVLDAKVSGLPGYVAREHLVLHHPDCHAANTCERPRTVVPRSIVPPQRDGRHLRVTLLPLSWNVVRLSKQA
ncbi:MAG: hypothetical protein ACUVX9_04295 [Anaerolineae bacterium]